jgi:hypothetical protein
VLAIALVLASCSSSSSGSTTSSVAPQLPSSSTTQATTTTTTGASQTTTSTALDPLVITLSGGTVAYTTTGDLSVEGWVATPAAVTVGGTPTETHSDPGGRTSFFADLTNMDVGTHDIPIEATTPDGRATTRTLTIVHDPTLDRQFAYIVATTAEPSTVIADYAQWFVGEEADAAATDDGVANADGTVDGGFYIRNVDERLRTLPIDAGASVVLHACYVDGPCLTREAVDFEAFRALTENPSNDVATVGWHWYGSGTLPYWLFIADDVIVHIEEQYLP